MSQRKCTREAFLSWGGRLGEIAEDGWPRRYMRAIELQGDVGYSHGFGSGGSDEIFFDPVLDYSMPYVGYSTDLRAPWPFRNLCVFTEAFNFDQLLSAATATAPCRYSRLRESRT